MPKRSLDQRQVAPGAAARAAAPASGFCTSVSRSVLEAIVAPVTLAPGASGAHFTNWANTFKSDAAAPQMVRVIAPESIEQVMAAVELARRGDGKNPIALRAVGRLHSPSDLPFSLGWTLRTDELAGIVRVDMSRQSPTPSRHTDRRLVSGTWALSPSRPLLASSPLRLTALAPSFLCCRRT